MKGVNDWQSIMRVRADFWTRFAKKAFALT